MNRTLIISSDCHAGAPTGGYREYLDPRHRPLYDELLARPERMDDRVAQAIGLRLAVVDPAEAGEAEGPGPLTSHWTAERRLAELEKDGIVAEVVFPQPAGPAGPPFYSFGHAFDPRDAELTAAGCRAYNRWIADFVASSPHPERHAGLALIGAVDDVPAALKEIEWAKRAGLRGVVLRSQPIDGPGYHHPRYEPIWSVCEELGMPVHTHGGETPEYGDLPASRSIFFTEVIWYAHRLFWFLLWSGALERHPGLRLVLTEQFADWIPDLLHRLDEQYQGEVAAVTREGQLSMKPSEYWARQCYVGASFMSRRECERRHAIGVDTIMWGSDFPHDEGTWPRTREALHETFDGVPEEELRRMLGTNAAAVYGFDVEALAPHVERVGPEVAEFL